MLKNAVQSLIEGSLARIASTYQCLHLSFSAQEPIVSNPHLAAPPPEILGPQAHCPRKTWPGTVKVVIIRFVLGTNLAMENMW